MGLSWLEAGMQIALIQTEAVCEGIFPLHIRGNSAVDDCSCLTERGCLLEDQGQEICYNFASDSTDTPPVCLTEGT